jgi:hypothetical protein
MAITLPLETMTVEEKLQTMEAIWSSLCSGPLEPPSPEWHGEVLKQRDQSLQRGDDRFEPWEKVRSELRQRGT